MERNGPIQSYDQFKKSFEDYFTYLSMKFQEAIQIKVKSNLFWFDENLNIRVNFVLASLKVYNLKWKDDVYASSLSYFLRTLYTISYSTIYSGKSLKAFECKINNSVNEVNNLIMMNLHYLQSELNDLIILKDSAVVLGWKKLSFTSNTPLLIFKKSR